MYVYSFMYVQACYNLWVFVVEHSIWFCSEMLSSWVFSIWIIEQLNTLRVYDVRTRNRCRAVVLFFCVCAHLWVFVSYFVIFEGNEQLRRIGDTNFLVSCQTEWMKEVQNNMAVPTVDDGFKPDDVWHITRTRRIGGSGIRAPSAISSIGKWNFSIGTCISMTAVKISHSSAASVDVDVHLLRLWRSTWDATQENGLILAVSVAKPLLRQVQGIHTRKFTSISLHMSAVSVESVLSGLACCGGMSSSNIPTSDRSLARSVESGLNCWPCWEVTCDRYTAMNMRISVRTAQRGSSCRAAWRSTDVPFTTGRSRTSAACVTDCSAKLRISAHTCVHIRGNVRFSVPSVD